MVLQLHSHDYNLYDLIAITIVKAPKSYIIAMDLGNFQHKRDKSRQNHGGIMS